MHVRLVRLSVLLFIKQGKCPAEYSFKIAKAATAAEPACDFAKE